MQKTERVGKRGSQTRTPNEDAKRGSLTSRRKRPETGTAGREEGWRLCISRAGSTFIRYFPDKKLGGPKQSLASAEKALAEVKAMIEGSKRIEGKLPAATIKKIEKYLKGAVA